MSKHLVKCAVCGKSFDRDAEQAVLYSARRYAHYACAPDKELAPFIPPSQDEKDIQAIKDYAMSLLGDNYSARKVTNQIKTFHEKDGYSYSGILKSLVYFYNVQNNDISKANGGIGIVPYVYNDARNYYLGIYMAQQANVGVDVKKATSVEKEFTIKPPKANPLKKLKLFNLEEIKNEE